SARLGARVMTRLANRNWEGSAKRRCTSRRMASLPAPLGPTIKTIWPGPRPALSASDDASAATIDLAHHRKITHNAPARQIGAQPSRDLAAIGQAGGPRRAQRHATQRRR